MKAEEIRRSVADTVAKGPARLYKEAILRYLSVNRFKEYLQAGMTRNDDPGAGPEVDAGVDDANDLIVGAMLEGLAKETKAAKGFLIRVATALWWLVEAAVPGGLEGHFFRKFFVMAFWLEIVMVVGGTIFSHLVQAVGLKLLAFTNVVVPNEGRVLSIPGVGQEEEVSSPVCVSLEIVTCFDMGLSRIFFLPRFSLRPSETFGFRATLLADEVLSINTLGNPPARGRICILLS